MSHVTNLNFSLFHKPFQIVVPALPGKAFKKQLPSFMRSDDGIFEDDFIEERRKGLELFINKYVPDYIALCVCKSIRFVIKATILFDTNMADISFSR